MFFGCTVPPDSKETEFGSRDQKAFLSACKNTGIVLVPCCAWKCVSIAIFSGEECYLLRQMTSWWESKKLIQSLESYELTAYPL